MDGISAIKGGGGVRRLMANAIKNVHIFFLGILPFDDFVFLMIAVVS